MLSVVGLNRLQAQRKWETSVLERRGPMSRSMPLRFVVVLACVIGLNTFSDSAEEPDPDATFKRIFKRIDANDDGVITQQEYVDRSRWQDKNQARAIWRASDANGDGKVTEAEYCENRRVTDKAKEVFAWLDANRDGRVNEREIVDRAKEVFVEMDRNGNAEVTIPEFLATRWQWQVRIQWQKKRPLFELKESSTADEKKPQTAAVR